MPWKFYSEAHENIPLPPEYKFPQALNYLNPETNSFYILEKGKDYMQVGGSKQKCTVELRQYDRRGKFKHFVFYRKSGSDIKTHIEMSAGGVYRKEKHCFGFLTAAKLLTCYYENKDFPDDVLSEDITHEFMWSQKEK